MSFMDKIKGFVSGDDEYDDDDVSYGDDNGYDEPAPQQNQQYAQQQYTQAAPQRQSAPTQTGNIGGFGSGTSLELKIVKPTTFDTATVSKIGDHLLNRRSVVINIEETNKESARRIIDYVSGVTYAIGGYIQRVAANTFIAVPQSVEISRDQVQEARKQEEDNLY